MGADLCSRSSRIFTGARFRLRQPPSHRAGPAYVRPGGKQSKDNAAFIIALAAQVDGLAWPFDTTTPPAVIKTKRTQSMKGKTWPQREEIAAGELRAAFSVPDVTRTRGKRIIVFDDLYTTGHT